MTETHLHYDLDLEGQYDILFPMADYVGVKINSLWSIHRVISWFKSICIMTYDHKGHILFSIVDVGT